ncbi:MAG: hypothetical protein K9K82_09260 [Desulfobacteraceae bacterium]|nr:hypothetical protein [Desulfobacteraceae bacterium]
MKFRQRFIEDTFELDENIIPAIREYINAEAWGLVEEEANKHIEMIRGKLYELHQKDPERGYILLAECESVSDVLHTRNWINCNTTKPISKALLGAFEIKENLLFFPNDTDYLKEELLRDVDRLQAGLKETLLELLWPKKLAQEKSLTPGRKKSKKREGIVRAVAEIIREEWGRGKTDFKNSEIRIKFEKKYNYSKQREYLDDDFRVYVDGKGVVQVDLDTKKQYKPINLRTISDRYVDYALEFLKK